MSLLYDALEDKKLDYKAVKDNIVMFFLAGHETTSATIQYCLYHLAKNPEYQENLRALINNEFPDPNNLDYEKLKEFKTLEYLVNETLRIFPPVAYITRRSTEDLEIEGWFIPKKWNLVFNIWDMHRDVQVWGDDAREFKPDRFLNLTKIQKKSFLPFGGGARICIGMQFSLLEQKIFYIKLLKKFKIEWDPTSVVQMTTNLLQPVPETFKFIFKPINE